MSKVLVVNAGSSSMKWKLFNKDDLSVVAEGLVERIFVDGVVETKFNGEKQRREVTLNSHAEASAEVVADLKSMNIIENIEDITNIGYRVVQGGSIFKGSALIDEKSLKQIEDLSPLAPLHNPGAVQAIKAFQAIFTNAIGTATFDTSFHSTISEVNYTYPIDQKLAKELNIRKYGMHGTSHKFITRKLEETLKQETVSFVNLHIGNGGSLCAVKDSKSFDTSMGLSPLAGIMMGTRSGDIDPSIHAYVYKEKGILPDAFDKMLNSESGLKGVSGFSSDMRDIRKAVNEGNEQAILAYNLYVQKIIDYTAIYLNKIGKKSDAIVFTAGVGENSTNVRKDVVSGLALFGIKIDQEKNTGKIGDVELISTEDSSVPVYVIRTDEELMIAKDNLDIAK